MNLDRFRAAGRWIGALAVIFAAWAAGEGLAAGFNLPVPAALIGLALLFLGFCLAPPLVSVTEPAAQTLLRHFPLFLYPLGAGFLTLHDVGAMVILKILVTVFVSLVFSLLVGVQVFRIFKNKHG
ncbi:holin-like protein [Pararhizobium capsulatum DSM 1112]|uniref:Holin-like protein n=1 Tax=Pararhizobium capsulatum DSM 1112 TaxID=1121113 RepID=A0ABU0BYI2_9HYPH|nr:CidA/LrgA family protein [Pararhizobium capsulatum]MDQ0323326.1 holin-like protein [Pararhizobium capsulatum DSM 1112]